MSLGGSKDEGRSALVTLPRPGDPLPTEMNPTVFSTEPVRWTLLGEGKRISCKCLPPGPLRLSTLHRGLLSEWRNSCVTPVTSDVRTTSPPPTGLRRDLSSLWSSGDTRTRNGKEGIGQGREGPSPRPRERLLVLGTLGPCLCPSTRPEWGLEVHVDQPTPDCNHKN